jgi:hypothetical protein
MANLITSEESEEWYLPELECGDCGAAFMAPKRRASAPAAGWNSKREVRGLMKKRRMPTLPDDLHDRKCGGCGDHYRVRSTRPTEKPLCTRCREGSARAQEKMAGFGWPLFRYEIRRSNRKPTRIFARKK